MRDHVASRYGDGYGRTHLYCSCGWRSGDYVRDATSDKYMAAHVASLQTKRLVIVLDVEMTGRTWSAPKVADHLLSRYDEHRYGPSWDDPHEQVVSAEWEDG